VFFFSRNDLVENESCDDFVWDIVNDIADVACDVIFQNIINERVAPYAVFSAKKLLLDLIEVLHLINIAFPLYVV